jgi:hypothetical protein
MRVREPVDCSTDYAPPMLLGIDHLVVAVRSVEKATAELERDVGLAFTGGGRHEGMGTYNRLAFLGGTYIELIGVFDRSQVLANPGFAVGRAALEHLDAGGDGLVTYALATDAIADHVAALHADGSDLGAAGHGSRTRDDGDVVRWWTSFPPALGPELPPFLIEHELTGAEWDDAARAARAAFRHPLGGAVRLASLALPVRDAAPVAEAYGRTLGIAFSEGWRTAIGGQSVALAAGAPVPVVELLVEPGTPALDRERFGIRWRHVYPGSAASLRMATADGGGASNAAG